MNATEATVPACGVCGSTYLWVDYAERCCRCKVDGCPTPKIPGVGFCELHRVEDREARVEAAHARMLSYPTAPGWSGPVYSPNIVTRSGESDRDDRTGLYFWSVAELYEHFATRGTEPEDLEDRLVFTCTAARMEVPDLIKAVEDDWFRSGAVTPEDQERQITPEAALALSIATGILTREAPWELLRDPRRMDPAEMVTQYRLHLKLEENTE